MSAGCTGNTTVVNPIARRKGAVHIIMSIINVKLTRISVYETIDAIRYRFIFDKAFPAYVRNENGEIVLSEANYIDFAPAVAIAQIVNCIPDLACIHTDASEKAIRKGVRGGLTAAQLQLILTGADIAIERTQFNANDPYKRFDGTDAVHENAGFSSEVKEIRLTEQKMRLLNDIQEKLLLNSLM